MTHVFLPDVGVYQAIAVPTAPDRIGWLVEVRNITACYYLAFPIR
jgi:hypothetical protein